MLGFLDNVQRYNGKKLIEIKLGFWDNVQKYNVEMKLGFWENVQKYDGKKLKAWVWGQYPEIHMIKNL